MNLDRVRIKRLLQLLAKNPETVRYLALEAAWTARPTSTRSPPLSWSLPPETLAKTTIRWPSPVPLPDAGGWVASVKAALAEHVEMMPTTIHHPFTSILLFDVVVRGRSQRIAVDYRDSNELASECANSADVYFKLQFANGGYAWDNVVPGGYVVSRQKFYRYLPRLRALRQRDPMFEVYGRFGPRGERIRRKIVDDLRMQKVFRYTGGLGTVLYSQSLREMARAKISVDLPGNGWFCHRLVESLAIGSCIVAMPHGNQLHVPLVDRKHVAYCRPGGEDLVDLCSYYLDHEDERAEMMANALDYFDRYLHYRQLGAYYLSVIYDRLD
jgi:Glycosyl transferases group 1